MTKFTSDDYGEGYWERAEGSNYTNYGDDPGWAGILHAMAVALPPGRRILEVACAKGYFIKRARKAGHDAVGFDLSEYAISKSVAPEHTRVHDATSCPWPWEDLPLEDRFDIVAAWEFFEHIPEDDVCQVIECMRECLKPDGQIWLKTGIVVPDTHDFAGQEDHDHTHVTMWDREQWEAEFKFHDLTPLREPEALLDEVFASRDWKGRFFILQKEPWS